MGHENSQEEVGERTMDRDNLSMIVRKVDGESLKGENRIEGEERQAFIGRGEQPTWNVENVTVKKSQNEGNNSWRSAQASAMEAKHMLQAMRKRERQSNGTRHRKKFEYFSAIRRRMLLCGKNQKT